MFPGRYGPPLDPTLFCVDGPVALVNADIEVCCPPLLLEEAARGSLAFAHRVDLPTNKLYRWGVDLVAFDDVFRNKLRSKPGWGMFQLGAPWWDYVIPAAAKLMGVPLLRVDSPIVFHEEHEQRWNEIDRQIAGRAAYEWLRGLGYPDEYDDVNKFARACCVWFRDGATPITLNSGHHRIHGLAWSYVNRTQDVPSKFVSGKKPGFFRGLERSIRPHVRSMRKLFVK